MAQIEALNYRPCELSENPRTVAHLADVQRIGMWQHENAASQEILRSFLSGDKSAYPPHAAAEVDRLRDENHAFKESVRTSEMLEKRNVIESRYAVAESRLINPTNTQRAAARLGAFEGIQVHSDFDNSFTVEDPDKMVKINGIKLGHPGAVIADPILAEHTPTKGFVDAYTELYPASFQPIAQAFPEAYFENGRHTPLRDGAPELLKYLKDRNIPLNFISANITYTVWGALSQIEDKGDVRVTAMEQDSVKALHKDAVIVTEAVNNPNLAVIVIGDGDSDKSAMDARDIVGVYFALEGGKFAKDLKEANLLHFTYKNMTDIEEKLREIEAMNANSVHLERNPMPILISSLARNTNYAVS